MRHSRTFLAAATAVVTALTLTACGGSSDAGGDTDVQGSGNAASDDAFPVTIKHALGETVIESKPERVATVGWSNQEVAIALGVVPVVMEKATWGDDDKDGVMPWVEEELTKLGAETPPMYDATEGIDFAAIDESNPDVILAAYSGMTQEDYDTLKEIAPVVAYPDVAWGTTWQQMTIMDGTALGLKTEAEALVKKLEGDISTAVKDYPSLAGQGAMWGFLDPSDLSSVGFYTLQDPRALFLQEAGLTPAAAVSKASEDGAEFYTSISAEAVDELSDLKIIVTYGTDKDLAMAQGDPLLSKIPAFASGAVVLLPEDTPLAASANPSPLGIGYMIENYLPLLDEAAKKAA